jgi:hypothetical protein
LLVEGLPVVDGHEVSINDLVGGMGPPREERPEDEESKEVDGCFPGEHAYSLADLFLLLLAHFLKHFGVVLVVVGALLGFAPEVAGEVAKRAEGVVVLLLVGVREHFVGFVDLFELGVLAFIVIGMVDLGELVVSLLDVGLAGLLTHAQNLVVVLLGVEVRLVEHGGPGAAAQQLPAGCRR